MNAEKSLLTINSGSSSIKFAFYKLDGNLAELLHGNWESTESENYKLSLTNNITGQNTSTNLDPKGQQDVVTALVKWIETQDEFTSVTAIGHRIVHGMQLTAPQQITAELLDELKRISPYDPEHLPQEIKLIEIFSKRHPALKQVACFDTSFHTAMPPVAKQLAIPRRFSEKGLQRYGFHGLSYAFLMLELEHLAGKKAANGKVILAHLGSGASLAAVKNGKSLDTSMGFTPGSGVMMGTRCGDLDPGVAWYMMQFEKLTPRQFNHLVNHESGLLGISETSSDMRELMKREASDIRAAEAIGLFCYQIKKWIGSFTAVLGGIDTLIFSGGIGENIPQIRSQICHDLGFLGIELDKKRNQKNESIISADTGKVTVRVIATNEELMIARLVSQVLNYRIKQ